MRDQSDNAPVARRSQTPAPLGRDPFWAFRSEMDRLFDDFFTPRNVKAHSSARPSTAESNALIGRCE